MYEYVLVRTLRLARLTTAMIVTYEADQRSCLAKRGLTKHQQKLRRKKFVNKILFSLDLYKATLNQEAYNKKIYLTPDFFFMKCVLL